MTETPETSMTIRFNRPPRQVRARVVPRLTPELEAYVARCVEEAHARGRDEAERNLGEQLVSQRHEMVMAQNGALKGLRDAVPRVVRETEQCLIEIALTAAERLVSGLPVSAEMVAACVREAVSHVEETTNFEVTLHPEDLKLLEQGNEELASRGLAVEGVTFQAGGDVSRGGCVVRTQFGEIDGRRETKLQRLRETLAE